MKHDEIKLMIHRRIPSAINMFPLQHGTNMLRITLRCSIYSVGIEYPDAVTSSHMISNGPLPCDVALQVGLPREAFGLITYILIANNQTKIVLISHNNNILNHATSLPPLNSFHIMKIKKEQ